MISSAPDSWKHLKSPMNRPSFNETLNTEQARIEFHQKIIADDDNIPSNDDEGDDQIPALEILDDDVILSEGQRDFERIQLDCIIPYSEIYLVKETGEILLLYYRNYEISIPVGLLAKNVHTVN